MVSSDTRLSRSSLVPAWTAPALLACAAVLVPWAAILFLTLPSMYGASHWQLAWGGFDVGLGIALATTAITALRRSPHGEIAAAVTGTLLVCDAWFDVLTSHGSADVAKAVGEAALIELPLAALCFWIVRSLRAAALDRRVDVHLDLPVESSHAMPLRPMNRDSGNTRRLAACSARVKARRGAGCFDERLEGWGRTSTDMRLEAKTD